METVGSVKIIAAKQAIVFLKKEEKKEDKNEEIILTVFILNQY